MSDKRDWWGWNADQPDWVRLPSGLDEITTTRPEVKRAIIPMSLLERLYQVEEGSDG